MNFLYSVKIGPVTHQNKVLVQGEFPTKIMKEEILPDILKDNVFENVLPSKIDILQTQDIFCGKQIPHFVITIS